MGYQNGLAIVWFVVFFAAVNVASASELITQIERNLTVLGFDPGEVDHQADIKTAVAISQFQAEKGLEVTGEVSPQLAVALAEELEARGLAQGHPMSGAVIPDTSGLASVANPAQRKAMTEGMPINEIPVELFQLKFQPDSIDDNQWFAWNQQQIRSDVNFYRQVDKLEAEQQRVEEFIQNCATLTNAGEKNYCERNIATMTEGVATLTERLESARLGVVFERSEIEDRDLDFAARELKAKFQAHVMGLVAELPEQFTLKYTAVARNYVYDFDGQFLRHNSNFNHFFAYPLAESQVERFSGLEGYFLTGVPPRIGGYSPAYGFPIAFFYNETWSTGRGGAGVSLAIDRDMSIPHLEMDPQTAEAFINSPPSEEDQGIQEQAEFVGVIDFALSDVRLFKGSTVFVVSLDRVQILAPPDGHVLKAYAAEDFISTAEIVAQAEAEARAKDQEEAARLAAEAARYAAFDVLGVKIGMPMEEADSILQQTSDFSAVYGLERDESIPIPPFGAKPFGRSVAYIKLEGSLEPPAPPVETLSQEEYFQRVQAISDRMAERARAECRDPATASVCVESIQAEGKAEVAGLQSPFNSGRNRSPATDVSASEIVTVTVEKSDSGRDEVLGIVRRVSLPESTSPDAVSQLLVEKYGQPAIEQKDRNRGSWSWGKLENRYCKPSALLVDLRNGELRSGQQIPTNAKLTIFSVGSTSPSWQKLPNETGFESCGPVVQAYYQRGNLEVMLIDLKGYFARFEELFVSSPEEAATKPQLSL